MQAVLCDMDGTLVDSEKLWDVSLAALYAELGGMLTPEVRASLVGGSAEDIIRTVYTDLGLNLDPSAMAESDRWLHDYTGKLFDSGLPWCAGARELLEELAAEGIPMALVTNTQTRAHRAGAEQHWPPLFLGVGMRRRSAAWQARTRCLSAGGRIVGATAIGVPGHRGLRDRHHGRRERRMPGIGGAQRRRGARQPAAQAREFAERTRRRRPFGPCTPTWTRWSTNAPPDRANTRAG